MIDIREEKPIQNELILAALTFDKGTKSFSEGVALSGIHDWSDGVSHTVVTRNQDRLCVVTPLQWRPEYADIVSHWMPYPRHPALTKSGELWSKEL